LKSLIQIHNPIEITKEEIDAWQATKKQRSSDDNTTGIFYLDTKWVQERFQPILDKLGFGNLEITRGWVHYMRRGGFRPPHQHESITGLYYAVIPENSGRMVIDDKEIIPVQGDFYLLPKGVQHSITKHESDELRWALAFDTQEKQIE